MGSWSRMGGIMNNPPPSSGRKPKMVDSVNNVTQKLWIKEERETDARNAKGVNQYRAGYLRHRKLKDASSTWKWSIFKSLSQRWGKENKRKNFYPPLPWLTLNGPYEQFSCDGFMGMVKTRNDNMGKQSPLFDPAWGVFNQ